MVEPEVAFLELDGLLNLAEAYITHIVTTVLAHHRADLKVIGKDISKLEAVIAPSSTQPSVAVIMSEGTGEVTPSENSVIMSEGTGDVTPSENSVILSERSESKDREGASPANTAETFSTTNPNASGPATNRFPRLSYDEAHAMLDAAYKEGKIEAPHKYGDDFGSPDETYISSQFDKPVMIHRYPAAIKAFYMQPDPLDLTKALCVDVLAPEGYGEIIGGSQRVDSYDLLKSRIEEHNLPLAAFQWYLDLRKYGSVPHAGFGMGIERVVAWICGLDHVRETIPFARTLNRIYP
jgi:asparaginyl-tRNA synthetase